MFAQRSIPIAFLLTVPAPAQNCICYPNSPPGVDLQLGDDTAVVVPLPFVFTFDAVAHTEITVGANGEIRLGASTSTSDFSPTEGELLAEEPRICPMWSDWSPNVAGGVYFHANASQACVTWKGVPAFGSSTEFLNASVVLAASGEIDLYYDSTTTMPVFQGIIGISAGGGAQPAQVDLSTLPVITNATAYEFHDIATFDLPTSGPSLRLLPSGVSSFTMAAQALAVCQPVFYATAMSFGSGCPAAPARSLQLAAATLPSLGTVYQLEVSGIAQPGTVLVAVVLSFEQIQVDLTSLGMPGCTRYAGAGATHVQVSSGATSASAGFWVPNLALLTAAPVFAQAAAFTPGINALGVAASNGVHGLVGFGL